MTNQAKYIVAVREGKDWHGYPYKDELLAYSFYDGKVKEGFHCRYLVYNATTMTFILKEDSEK